MKYIVNLLVVGLIAFLAFVLYDGIREPIAFRAEKDKRKNVVVEKLQKIRTAQEIYREITGIYASSFDELRQTLLTDSIPFIQLLADPEDPTNPDKFITNTLYTNAKDSIQSMGIDLNDLENVPFSDNAKFAMQADTTTYQQTLVPVVECMTRWREFMGPYADVRFQKYDDSYDPDARIGFGSMSSPNLEGNWN